MEHLTVVFQQLLTMALTALPVMAVVLLARALLKKTPKKYTYLLWLVVAFRLVCPVAVESPVGIIRAEEVDRQVTAAADTYLEPTLTYQDNGGFTPDYDVLLNRGYTPNERGEIVTNEAGTREAWQVRDLLFLAAGVWLSGIAVMAAYLMFSTLRLRRQVATAVRREDNIWECDNISTPFVLGLLRPRIYIPFRMTEQERTYILAHERYHIRRGDHWAKLLALLILTVYWWNPAVWLCWVLFCRDMEMRCDEAVLEQLGDGVKRDYSLSLVSFALDRRAPMALAFGEHDAARRVKNVLRWKKAKPVVIFFAVAAVILVAVACGTNAAQKDSRVTVRTGETGGVEFEAHAAEDIHSWALYVDIYDGGRLISSNHRVLDGFADEGTGVSTRDFTGRLWADLEYSAEGGFTNSLTWNVITFGGAEFYETLPRDHYTGMVKVLGCGSNVPQTYKLGSEGGEVLLCSILLTTNADGAVTVSSAEKPLTQLNDTVVQYRLVLSGGTMEELETPPLDLAQTLFDLRVTSREDYDGVRALLTAMGADDIGPYSLVTYRSTAAERVLEIHFEEPLMEQQELQMGDNTYLLMALVADVDRIDYAFPTENGSSTMTFYGDGTPLDNWAKTLGYENIKDLGQSVEGIRALMEYLTFETPAAPESTEPEVFVSALLQQEVVGHLLDDYEPYDMYFDLDTWEDESVDVLGCYLYYSLTRAQFRQFVKELDEVPVELQDAELEGDESDIAKIAVSGEWPRAEVEAIRADLLARTQVDGQPLSDETETAQPTETPALSIVTSQEQEMTAAWFPDEQQETSGYPTLVQSSGGELTLTLSGTGPETLTVAEDYYDTFSGALLEQKTYVLPRNADGGYTLDVRRRNEEQSELAVYTVPYQSGKFVFQVQMPKWQDRQAFTDILGYDGYISTESMSGGFWNDWTYYAVENGREFPIAESFGFSDSPQVYHVDLDGDGMKELVANVQFGGDGYEDVYVYRRAGDGPGGIQIGTLDLSNLPNHDDWGANSTAAQYDAGANVFRIRYAQKGAEEYAVLETHGLDRFVFSEYGA